MDMALTTVSSLNESFTSGVPLLSEEAEHEHTSSEKLVSGKPTTLEVPGLNGEEIKKDTKLPSTEAAEEEAGGQVAGEQNSEQEEKKDEDMLEVTQSDKPPETVSIEADTESKPTEVPHKKGEKAEDGGEHSDSGSDDEDDAILQVHD